MKLTCPLFQSGRQAFGRLLAPPLAPLLVLILVLTLALAPPGTARAAVIDVSASTNTLSVGQDVFVFFSISGLSGAPGDSLGAFDMDIIYDPTVLRLWDVGFHDDTLHGNPLALPEPGSFAFIGDAIDLGQRIDAFGLSGNSAAVLDADQPNAFTLMTLTFRAVGPSIVSGVVIDTLDPALLFVDSGANALAASIGRAGVTLLVAPAGDAPEPASLLLLLAGAAALLAARPRQCGPKACAGAASASAATAEPAPTSKSTAAAAAALLALGLAGAAPARAQTPPGSAPATSPSQQGQAAPPTRPAPAAPAGGAESIDGTVVAVQGQRAQLRLRNGALRWLSVAAPLTPAQVGKRITGIAVVRGDALMLDQPRIYN
ncbi:PEP-CTERM sorting domain-containing protein [Rugamonas sp. DEMB1]|uniref:PEP-CTERM sorting domain-containing protein n=1 Tax=Rugamonas sp. DEMB1 TaxID=3039386 RepID=UPI00244CE068|nr:PEP-CTERM sorting domain-containing protein [Rugamonas sp. DEMB1]WGG52748.1 PEP-CTERM sorting domain-containing protein [Rugamonas sp. DEMB1]